MIATLQSLHADKRTELMVNGEELLKQEQEKWKAHLRKKGWRTFKTEELRTLAKKNNNYTENVWQQKKGKDSAEKSKQETSFECRRSKKSEAQR